MPSETEMLKKLQAAKIPVRFIKPNTKRLQPVSGLLAALLVKYPDMQYSAQRTFITYLRSIYIQRDKEVFDVMKLPIEEFSASLGLPMTPKIRFLNQKTNGKTMLKEVPLQREEAINDDVVEISRKKLGTNKLEDEEVEDGFLAANEMPIEGGGNIAENGPSDPGTRILKKKKKLKINVHRPIGTRVVFDEEGNTLPPLAALADTQSGDGLLQVDKVAVNKRFEKLREELKQRDKEDKALHRQRLREKRTKEKIKQKRAKTEDDVGSEEDYSESDREETGKKTNKRSKIYFDSDDDDGEKAKSVLPDAISVAEQEALALKLLSSMHS